MEQSRFNLLVLYSNERDQLRTELNAFGLVFNKHQHGNGPIHDACDMHGLCIEIYPASENNPPTHTRIGFTVPDINKAMKAAYSISAKTIVAPNDSQWGKRAVIQLKSGLKVELVQPK